MAFVHISSAHIFMLARCGPSVWVKRELRVCRRARCARAARAFTTFTACTTCTVRTGGGGHPLVEGFSRIFRFFLHFSGVHDSPTPHSNNDPGPHYAHSTGARRATHLPGLAPTATRGARDPELNKEIRGGIGGSAITTPHTREGELAEPQRHIFFLFFSNYNDFSAT